MVAHPHHTDARQTSRHRARMGFLAYRQKGGAVSEEDPGSNPGVVTLRKFFLLSWIMATTYPCQQAETYSRKARANGNVTDDAAGADVGPEVASVFRLGTSSQSTLYPEATHHQDQHIDYSPYQRRPCTHLEVPCVIHSAQYQSYETPRHQRFDPTYRQIHQRHQPHPPECLRDWVLSEQLPILCSQTPAHICFKVPLPLPCSGILHRDGP